jgi:hypothetical protein
MRMMRKPDKKHVLGANCRMTLKTEGLQNSRESVFSGRKTNIRVYQETI